MNTQWQVIVVGGGPAGLAAATTLRNCGVTDVLLIEQAAHLGGWLRYLPALRQRLHRRLTHLDGCHVWLQATVLQIAPGPQIVVRSAQTTTTLHAKRLLMATGSAWQRTTPHLSVTPLGQVLQQPSLGPALAVHSMGELLMPTVWNLRGYRLPIRGILPTDLADRTGGLPPFQRWALRMAGIPMLRQVPPHTLLLDTTGYVPHLPLHHHLMMQSGAIAVDQYGRSHDPWIFAAGDVLRPPRSVAVAIQEGERVAHRLVASLRGDLPLPTREIPLLMTELAYPQRLAEPGPCAALGAFRYRHAQGSHFTLFAEGWPIARRRCRPWPGFWQPIPLAWLRVPWAKAVEISMET